MRVRGCGGGEGGGEGGGAEGSGGAVVRVAAVAAAV